MSYVSKYDTKFLTFMNRKYRKYHVKFEFWDDYILWLYFDLYKMNDKLYYKNLEKDMWEYVEFQSGKERDKRDKLTSRWENEYKKS